MEGDSFCLELDEDDQEKKWMNIEITFTDIDNVEHTFLYYNEKYAKENEEEEESIEFGQDIVWISSLCDDFELAAKIFEKWALTGELYSRPWRHQWKGKDGKSNYEIYGLEQNFEVVKILCLGIKIFHLCGCNPFFNEQKTTVLAGVKQ